jgi:hypothetical protein
MTRWQIFLRSCFPLFATSPRQKKYFSKPKKELLPVALFGQEKLFFLPPGFPLQSGLRDCQEIKYSELTKLVFSFSREKIF